MIVAMSLRNRHGGPTWAHKKTASQGSSHRKAGLTLPSTRGLQKKKESGAASRQSSAKQWRRRKTWLPCTRHLTRPPDLEWFAAAGVLSRGAGFVDPPREPSNFSCTTLSQCFPAVVPALVSRGFRPHPKSSLLTISRMRRCVIRSKPAAMTLFSTIEAIMRPVLGPR